MTNTFGDVVRSIPSYTFPFLTVTCTTHPCKDPQAWFGLTLSIHAGYSL